MPYICIGYVFAILHPIGTLKDPFRGNLTFNVQMLIMLEEKFLQVTFSFPFFFVSLGQTKQDLLYCQKKTHKAIGTQRKKKCETLLNATRESTKPHKG